MNVTLIGNNKDSIKFLSNFEYTNNVEEANVVVFDGNINYRSATLKYNKLKSNQTVITFNTCSEFLCKKYNCSSYVSIRNLIKNETVDVICNNGLIYQGIVNNKFNKLFVPDSNVLYKVYFGGENRLFAIGRTTMAQAEFIEKCNYLIPLVMVVLKENQPNLLIINLDVNIKPESEISRKINDIICELISLH